MSRNESLICALDIGGSSVKYGVISIQKTDTPIVFKDKVSLRSKEFKDLRNQVIHVISKLMEIYPDIKSIAISTTGGVDDKTGIVKRAGHFSGYKNVSWTDIILPLFPNIDQVFVVNDGKAATWAEFTALDSSSVSYFAHFVVGTGIGGAMIAHQKFIVGDGGYAGYLGHIKITEEKTIRCSCGSFGCVETLASATAIIYHYKNATGLEEVSFSDIVEKVHMGDKQAISAVKKGGFYLGKVIAIVMNLINPQNITIGGGVPLAFVDLPVNIFVQAAEESARYYAHRRVHNFTLITLAHFGNDAGLIGAARLSTLKELPF